MSGRSPAMSGRRPRPWRKLWCEERGTFATLPLYARALAAELLKIADEHGIIEIGRKSPVDYIAFVMGATQGDRRLLRQHLPMLEADGYLRVEASRIVISAFQKWQGADPTDDASRERAANENGTSRERARTSSERDRNENEAKSPETLTRKSQDVEEDIEEEEEEDISAQGRAKSAFVASQSDPSPSTPEVGYQTLSELNESMRSAVAESVVAKARSVVLSAYRVRYERETGELWQGAGRAATDIDAAASVIASKGAEQVEARANRMMDAVFADEWMRARSWPWGSIGRDPARWLRDATKSAAGPSAPKKTKPKGRIEPLWIGMKFDDGTEWTNGLTHERTRVRPSDAELRRKVRVDELGRVLGPADELDGPQEAPKLKGVG